MDEFLEHIKGSHTSWGKRDQNHDVHSKRRYRTILDAIGDVGEIGCLACIIVAVIIMVMVMMTENFETIVFYDGTENYCFYDSSTETVLPLPPDI